jgi:hypothetical protein
MTPRSVRRAAERKALKLARKAEKAMPQIPAEDSTEIVFTAKRAISDAQLAANRANAQLSTGPTSETGRAKSSLNAVKTGLTGRTVLLPGDDAALYEAHIAAFIKRFEPATDEERNLVQCLADTEWRLLRIPALEFGIYALGLFEFADQFAKEDQAVRKQLLEAKIFLAYRKDLSNLSLQESRLRRQREKDTADLKQLQDARHGEARRLIGRAAQLCEQARREGKPFGEAELVQFGFEFSMEPVEDKIQEWKDRRGSSPGVDWVAYRAELKAKREREAEELQRELDAA